MNRNYGQMQILAGEYSEKTRWNDYARRSLAAIRSSLVVTYPNRADSSAVAAVGILFLSLEQNGGE